MFNETLETAEMAFEMEETALIKTIWGFFLMSLNFTFHVLVELTLTLVVGSLISITFFYCLRERKYLKSLIDNYLKSPMVKLLKRSLAWLEPPPPPLKPRRAAERPAGAGNRMPAHSMLHNRCTKLSRTCERVSDFASGLQKEREKYRREMHNCYTMERSARLVAEEDLRDSERNLEKAKARIVDLESQNEKAQARLAEVEKQAEDQNTQTQARIAEFECITAQLKANWRDTRVSAAKQVEALEGACKGETEKLTTSEKKKDEIQRELRREQLALRIMQESCRAQQKAHSEEVAKLKSNLQYRQNKKGGEMEAIYEAIRTPEKLSRSLDDCKNRFSAIKWSPRHSHGVCGGAIARRRMLRETLKSRNGSRMQVVDDFDIPDMMLIVDDYDSPMTDV
ncbi:hypothetical protein XA68_11844 [Ophiocordyceps unilateralis]|uniref:Uncharacterized protein n=1 Tax=Ophiocordyceps unilateralis TaxID=268505 RepID=A0A2A9PG69_OPHUN|nr:hypothetical protein XA68_11844 [Ophiocordyceps unilateralis]